MILAPLQVIGFYAPTDPLTLGWATFLVGAAIGHLLAEVHSANHGAFLWSGELAAFVLFAASAVAVLRAAATGGAGKRRLVRFTLCGAVFLWYVTSGFQYLYAIWLA